MDEINEPAHEAEAEEAAGEEKSAKVFNRQALVAVVSEKTGLPRGKALSAVEAVFGALSASLKDGKEVRVLGFGAFVVSERKAGKGRDPRTGEEIDIPHSKSVRFRPGKALKDLVADTVV
jgi:DNA-binding protein HU-beta